jgi:hypothetical protein
MYLNQLIWRMLILIILVLILMKKFLNHHFNLEYFEDIKKKYTKLLTDTKLKISNINGLRL